MDQKKPKHDDPEQSKQFIKAAKEAEADETEEGTEPAIMKVIASKSETTNKAA
jgi:hypothetical protein